MGTTAAFGTKSAPGAILLEFGSGLVTLELATAAAVIAERSSSGSSPWSSPPGPLLDGPAPAPGNGLEGLKTGAEADIRPDFGGGVDEVWSARRFGVGGAADIVVVVSLAR